MAANFGAIFDPAELATDLLIPMQHRIRGCPYPYAAPVSQSWSERVGTQGWRRGVDQWIRAALEQHGLEVVGTIEQPRIRPWSTQLMVPTGGGRVWFKANCPSMAFEPRLQVALSQLMPDDVDAPLAIEDDQGWMLTLDRGPSLGDSREPTSEDWQEVVSHTARVQRALAFEQEALTEAGLPDFSPSRVPQRFDRLTECFAQLPASHPSHASGELVDAFDSARAYVVEAAQQVGESAIPSTFQHGDVHPWNVFAADMRLFDFGDAQWAFALESLAVPYGWITGQAVLAWEPVRDAYVTHFADLVTAREFEALWHASTLTHAVNRSATWWGALQGANDTEWAEWGAAPLAHLRNVLELPR